MIMPVAPCPVCNAPVGRDPRGRVLMHTRFDRGGKAEICPGSDKGAKP